MYPKRVSDGMTFKIVGFVKKFWQRWNKETNKVEKSDAWMDGFSPRYLFDIEGGQLELSKDQLGQVFIAAFEQKKHWKDCVFSVKTNGKTGLEVRYFINALQTSNMTSQTPKTPPMGQNTTNSASYSNSVPPQYPENPMPPKNGF